MADGPDDLEAIPEDYSIPINNITIGPEIGHGNYLILSRVNLKIAISSFIR